MWLPADRARETLPARSDQMTAAQTAKAEPFAPDMVVSHMERLKSQLLAVSHEMIAIAERARLPSCHTSYHIHLVTLKATASAVCSGRVRVINLTGAKQGISLDPHLSFQKFDDVSERHPGIFPFLLPRVDLSQESVVQGRGELPQNRPDRHRMFEL